MVEIFQNIRKIYVFSDPCEALKPYIEFFSESSIPDGLAAVGNNFSSVKMFPSWTPTFYINLGTPYYIDLKAKRYLIKVAEDILILRNDDITRHKLPADHLYTIKFNPGGLEAILGINQLSLADKITDLRQVLPLRLLDNIRRAENFEVRTALMQNYLLRVFERQQTKDHFIGLVNDAIGEYTTSGMSLSTSHVAERVFVTSKTINRYFNRIIGISPKAYFSMLRARTALTAYVSRQDEFVPFDFGYYDISHFHKDVIRFTGKKLTQHKI
ncbi:AraC family transcriptional regulator [Pedobacter duraquae]|uniref:HTH araC/xylS-type domain-containing protein n=1 Tax=Pedobacter duraquae TaxID=425511 RepID=A0A4R6IKW0_9SPHI|nr:helix-turn-helix domain-containing protein [Pedobacter duraquae]TDO22697.1 hypothetical protein CLV32_1678 [Pedobacter duraquae]